MNKKIIKILVLLVIISTLILITNSVNGETDYYNNTEAVKMITIKTNKKDELIGPALNVEKLSKTFSVVDFDSSLFFTSREYDIQGIVDELKNHEITSDNKYFEDMEKIANGNIVIYLGLNIAKPEGINKIELINSYGIDLLKSKDFNFVQQQADGSYDLYLEFAFKNYGGWYSGVGLADIKSTLTLKCYQNENDTTPKSESEVILTPVTGASPYISGETSNFGLTQDNKWIKLDKYSDYDGYVVGIHGDNLDSLKSGISYDKKTQTVTINNLGTDHRGDYITVNASNIHIVGTNEIGEIFCGKLKTTVTMDANATLNAFISKVASSDVDFNVEGDVEQTDYFQYIIGDTSITVKPMTYLKSTKIKFVDVNESDWYYGAIKYTTDRGILQGATETEFRPNKNITRGMIVTILWRMEGEPTITNGKDFPDVSLGQYYGQAVKWAATKNIVNGYNNGNFGPNDNITREQLATILCNYAKYKGKNINVTADTSKYVDWYKVTGYARPAMSWAIKTGVINGKYNGTRVDPQGTASRAEATAMIYNYCTKIK